MTTDRTHLSPVIPISLRRWIIGADELASQFVERACGITTRRANEIRRNGVVTDDEQYRFTRFFSISRPLLQEALDASRKHYSELALLS